ncbi:MAG: GLPGLI family protein [Bacteroidetes bacterium]|nr:GLPGLI family protein [Bacteroidota bacterium]
MKKTIATLTIILFAGNCLFAQHAHFTTSGKIEFNKNMNMYSLFKKRITKDNEAFMQPFYEQYVKNNPQFKVLKSTLSFSNNKTLFVPIEPENPKNNYFGDDPITNQPNTIYADYSTNMQTAQKAVFEETFLVKDTVRKFKWKITDETREIAGYSCRRANGIMLDSIYVVAFYTTEIPVSGGPESFHGLPGMILEVALPHENLTWVATRVTDTSLPPDTVVPPKKGKQVDYKGFWETIHKATKDWGEWGKNYLKGFAL